MSFGRQRLYRIDICAVVMTAIIFCAYHFCLADPAAEMLLQEESAKPVHSPYKVGPADVLSIAVYDDASLTGDFSVTADGKLVYPLLGQIPVAGLTVAEIKQKITVLLEKDYLYNPIVSVTVKEYRSQKVKILGNVSKPGIYYLDGPTRLFDLLSKTAGLSPKFGNVVRGQKARIVRQEGSISPGVSNLTIVVDLYELLVEGKDHSNIILKDEDVIYILNNRTIQVIGEVLKPGSYAFEEGMTILKAISLAGGPTKKASVKNTVIKRIEDGEEKEVRVKMSDTLRPDDIVEVPLSFW